MAIANTSRLLGIVAGCGAAVLLAGGAAQAKPAPSAAEIRVPCVLDNCSNGIAMRLIGEHVIATDSTVDGTPVGGLSGIDYDPRNNRYAAISDDRSAKAPARFYWLSIDADRHRLHSVKVEQVQRLKDANGNHYAEGAVDPESIRVGQDDNLYWTSEGNSDNTVAPSVNVSRPDGQWLRRFQVPAAFTPDANHQHGIRANLSFEGLTFTPSGDALVSTEGPLYQDGALQTLRHGALVRFVRFDPRTGAAKAQYAYPVDPVAVASQLPNGAEDNGVSEIMALDDHRLLVIERGWSAGYGNTVKVYVADTERASDVSPLDSLQERDDSLVPMRKQLLLDMRTQGIIPDNIEGVTLGKGRDGTPLLVFIADNNFNAEQKNQLLIFALDRWPSAG
ncbi:hypothetical protein R84981_001588 [Carnimonas sp. R-84981]|uniref:esterase-like activity of phytase family protein n=1 Tax=Carnimonas bestiolae TaxID=3402172 RepID=UPI003EDC5951